MNTRSSRHSLWGALAAVAISALCISCGGNKSGKGTGESANGGAGSCEPGSSGCQCKNGTECDSGATCSEGICTKQTVSALHISGVVQGCEVLLKEDEARVQDVQYGDDVKGSLVRESPNVALSFVSKSDEPLVDGSVNLVLVGGDAKGLTVVKFTCVNKAAEKVSDAKVSL